LWYGGDMQDALREIREYLRQNAYRNEEHVRLSLVCRVLQELGWNVWDPREVNTEFVPNPREDAKKVDVALFIKQQLWVIIEVKAVGGITSGNLPEYETQVRNYNRDHTALFSIITDGQKWMFYHSRAGGEFHSKLFRELDFLKDEFDDIENALSSFLTQKNILDGSAASEADKYLQSSNEEKAVRDCLPDADRRVLSPPYLTRPQAIVELLKEQGLNLTEEEVEKHLEKSNVTPSGESAPQPSPMPSTFTPNVRRQTPELYIPEDYQHARMRGIVMGHTENGWNPFLRKAVALALDKGHTAHFLNSELPITLKEGKHVTEGFKPVPGHNVSLQAKEANGSYEALALIAKILQCNIDIELTFRSKSPYAGDEMTIRLSRDGAKRIA